MTTIVPKWLKSAGRQVLRHGLKLGLAGLAAGSVSHQASAQNTQQFLNLFFQQGYGYCDARKLGKIWRTSPGQAKVIAGRKISWGNLNIVQRDWSRGVAFFRRYGFSCGRSSLPTERRQFTYNDADRVARAWVRQSKV